MSSSSPRLSINETDIMSLRSIGAEPETKPGGVINADEFTEDDYDIVEVDRTPAFEDDGKFSLPKKAATVMSSNISLVNTMVGAGLLSLPMVMFKLGIIIGVILIIVMGILGYFGMWFLAGAADGLFREEQKKNNGKYPDISISFTWVGNRLAPKVTPILNLILFLYSTGIMIAYLIVVGDAFPVVCRSYLYDDDSSSSLSDSDSSSEEKKPWYIRMLVERWFWILVVCVIVLPMSYAKKLDALRYISSFMLPCVMYIVILLIVMVAEESSHVYFYPRSTTAFSALSVLLFAYSGHLNYYTVYQELGPKNRRKRANITGIISSTLVITFYILAGLFGYIYSGPNTKGNIINSLPEKSVSSSIARIAIAFNVIVAYPVFMNPSRGALTGLLELHPKIRAMNKNLIHVITTTIIFALTLLAFVFKSIDLVLGFCGCLGSSLTSFVFPGYYYYRVYKGEPTMKVKVNLAIAFMVLGFVFMVVGFILQILDIV